MGLGPILIHLSAQGTQVLLNKKFPINSAGVDLVLDQSGDPLLLGPTGSLIRFDPLSTTPAVYAIENSASSTLSGQVSPLEMVTVVSERFGSSSAIAFDGVPAPLLSADATQVTVVAPSKLQNVTLVRVTASNGNSADTALSVVPSNPAIFDKVLNQDGTVNSIANPAAQTSVITLWANGGGLLSPALPDGTIASLPLPTTVLPIAASVYSQPAEILYAGASPGQILGLIQLNVRLPAINNLFTDNFLVQVHIGSAAASGIVSIKGQ